MGLNALKTCLDSTRTIGKRVNSLLLDLSTAGTTLIVLSKMRSCLNYQISS